MKTSCNSCNFRQFRENLLYFYFVSFPCELNVQIPEASGGFAPWTPILMIDLFQPLNHNKAAQFAQVLSSERSKHWKF